MHNLLKTSILLAFAIAVNGCSISYKFNGAGIDYSKTRSISVADFPNNAALVYAPLSNNLSDALTPMAVSADSYAAETKLTLTVRVRFTNNVAPEESFEKTYSAYQTFDSSRMLDEVQDELCNTMITEIAESIYHDTVAKW